MGRRAQQGVTKIIHFSEIITIYVCNAVGFFTKISCPHTPCMCHVFPATTFVEAGGGVGLSSLPPTCLTHPWRKSPTPTCGYTQQRRPALHVKNKSGEGESQSREKEEEEEERFTSRNQDNFFPFSTLVFSFSPPLRDFCLSSAEEEETYEKETGRRRLFALHSWLFFFRDPVRVSC